MDGKNNGGRRDCQERKNEPGLQAQAQENCPITPATTPPLWRFSK